MPTQWRPNNKVTFNKWKDCAVCGLPWPEKTLVLQYGVLRCPECVDQPGHVDALLNDQRDLVDVKPPWDPEEIT